MYIYICELIYYLDCRHEITGIITKIGSNVTKFKVGDKVGVGCLAATCLECEFCKNSQENYCDNVQSLIMVFSGTVVSLMVAILTCSLQITGLKYSFLPF